MKAILRKMLNEGIPNFHVHEPQYILNMLLSLAGHNIVCAYSQQDNSYFLITLSKFLVLIGKNHFIFKNMY